MEWCCTPGRTHIYIAVKLLSFQNVLAKFCVSVESGRGRGVTVGGVERAGMKVEETWVHSILKLRNFKIA